MPYSGDFTYTKNGEPYVQVDATGQEGLFKTTELGEPFVGEQLLPDPGPEFRVVPVELLAGVLPTWFDVNISDTPEDSLYYKIFLAISDVLSRTVNLSEMLEDASVLGSRVMTWPRILWTCPIRKSALDKLRQVTVTVGPTPVVLRRVRSHAELLFAHDPVYATSEDGFLYMRNLGQTALRMSSETGLFNLPGGPLVPDEEVWINTGGAWEPMSAAGSSVDYDNAVIDLGFPATIEVKFTPAAALTELDSLCIAIDDEPAVRPTVHDIWNPVDESGLLVSLSRIPGEDNESLAKRIRTAYKISQTKGDDITTSLVGHELGLVGTLPWNGKDTIDLTSLGIDNITYITVLDLPRTKAAREETLTPDADRRTFSSSAGSWMPGWLLYLNGTRVTQKTFPALDPSDIESTGTVDFGQEVTGNVTATYLAECYKTAVDPSIPVATLEPTANTPPGDYTVLYVRGIDAKSAANPSFVSELLTQEGLPSETYVLVAKASAAASPVAVGSTTWGKDAHWFDDTETAPQITHLPVPIK